MRYIITGNGSISVVIDSKPYLVNADHPNYTSLIEAINQKDQTKFLASYDIPVVIHNYSQGNLTVEGGRVFVNYENAKREIKNTAAAYLLKLLDQGLPTDNFANFIVRLMHNPSRTVVNGLWDLLQHMADGSDGVTLNEDGWIVAFKRLQPDFYSYMSGPNGKVLYPNPDNTGTPMEIRIPRNETDEDASNLCSYGLHFGGFNYLRNWQNTPGSLTLVVKVDPADVVSCPQDGWKLRTTAMTVIERFNGVAHGIQFINGIYPDPNTPQTSRASSVGIVALRPFMFEVGDIVEVKGIVAGERFNIKKRRSDSDANRYLIEDSAFNRTWKLESELFVSADQDELEYDDDVDGDDEDDEIVEGNLHIYFDRDVEDTDIEMVEKGLELPESNGDTEDGQQYILHYTVDDDDLDNLQNKAGKFNFVRQVTTGDFE